MGGNLAHMAALERIVPDAIAAVGPLTLLVNNASVFLPDRFGALDPSRWQEQFDAVVKQGRSLWTDGKLGTNGVACAQCHPNAANTHPETYPKFQKQLGKVANLWEMVNWCLRNPLQGQPLAADQVKAVSKWPSRREQLSILSGQILAPGAMLSAQLLSAGGKLASQIKKKGEGADAAETSETSA